MIKSQRNEAMHYPPNEPITFSRDCDAVIIPSGDEVKIIRREYLVFLLKHLVEASLYTLKVIFFESLESDADAIGKEPIEPPETFQSIATTKEIEKVVWEQLKTCYDPEIPINVVDLGLIYSCEIQTVLNRTNIWQKSK